MQRHSRVHFSPNNFEASGVCDRCYRRFNRSELRWQHDWAGSEVINKRWLVCWECLDNLSNKNRTIRLRPDPTPVRDARPRDWVTPETNYLEDEHGNVLTDENGNPLITD